MKYNVSYDIALKLKDLGFNIPCLYYHWDQNFLPEAIITNYHQELTRKNHNNTATRVSIPTYEQVLDWFETEYAMFIERIIETTPNEILSIEYNVKSWRFKPYNVGNFWNKYDAYEHTIQYMIKKIKE